MASYFWIGGTGTWDSSLSLNWSLSSGGLPGAGPPTSGDTVTFDSLSGTGTCTTAATAACASFTLNSATLALTLGANLTCSSGTTTLTQGVINTGGFNLTCQFFNSSNANTRSIAFGTTGKITITGNNASVLNIGTVTGFTYTGTSNITFSYSGGTGTRTVGFATGFSEANALNYFITAGTDIFQFPIANSVDFTGFSGTLADTAAHSLFGSLTLSATMTMAAGTNGLFMRGTAGPYTVTTNGVTINSRITFGSSNAPGTWQLADAFTTTAAFNFQTGTLKLKAGAVTTVATFATPGTNQKTLQSTLSGTKATLSQASGAVSISRTTIKDIAFTGGATWRAPINQGNVDGGGNAGINFGAVGGGAGGLRLGLGLSL